MAAIEEDKRIAELRRLGISEPLIRLSSGEALHEALSYSCLGRPYYVYNRAGTPDGPPLIPLWDCHDTVFAVWERPDGPEFIKYDIEAPNEYTSLARTEQGFWVNQFDFLYECEVPIEELQEAAAIVGFRFLSQHLEAREAAESRLGAFEGHHSWLRELAADIDRRPGGSRQPAG